MAASTETKSGSPASEPRLFHPQLNLLPLPVRFLVSGIVGNVFFMAIYNWAYYVFQGVAGASQIFAVVQFLCIIVNHFLNVGIVFGWPKNYLQSLMNNMPVGLISLALGAVTMGQLEKAGFDEKVESMLGIVDDDPNKKGGFFASIVVMIVTGVFNYVALNIVNAPSGGEDDDEKKKKEL